MVESCAFRSFALISLTPEQGLLGQGIRARVEKDGIGYISRIFDSYLITSPVGKEDGVAALAR